MNRIEEIELMQKQILHRVDEVREEYEKPLVDKWNILEIERVAINEMLFEKLRNSVRWWSDSH